MLSRANARNLVSLVIAALLFGGGYWIGRMNPASQLDTLSDQAFAFKQLRESAGTYTNPLLMCDVQEEHTNPLYAPLQLSVASIVNESKKAGVKSASVYFRDLSRGTSFVVNPGERYIPASLNKVPLMMKVFERAQTDPTFLNRQIVSHDLTDANRVQLIQPKASMKAFAQYTMEEAVKLMIIHSDNNAYNEIVKHIPYDDYLALFNELKITIENGKGITVGEHSYFLRVLYNSTVLSKEMSEKALEFLTQTDYAQGLRAGVPAEIAVAHKFGTSGALTSDAGGERQLHDCGIIYVPGKPYLLCVMTKGTAEIEMLEELISGISRHVYGEVLVLE